MGPAAALAGAAFGVVTEGDIRVDENGQVTLSRPAAWLSPYCVTNGLLALSTCAYLAAVYLTNETHGLLRDDFRRRAIAVVTHCGSRDKHARRLLKLCQRTREQRRAAYPAFPYFPFSGCGPAPKNGCAGEVDYRFMAFQSGRVDRLRRRVPMNAPL